MANRCVSLDSTWAHLPAPHHTWLSPDDALTAALWASMAPSSSYSSAASPTPSSSTTTTSSAASAEIFAGAASARPAACGGTRGRAATTPTGRVSKRKPRPSQRARTTYISADPADFRRMVQEITGFPVSGAHTAYASASSSTQTTQPAPALACVLPTLDTSAFLLDRASPPPPTQPERKSKNTTVVLPATTMASTPSTAADDEAPSSLLLQELEEMISASAFPTLESWGMI